MMARGLVIVCFLVLAAIVNAQSGVINVEYPDNTLTNIPVGTQSDYILVKLTEAPNPGTSISLDISSPTDCSASPSTLSFDQKTRQLSFRVTCSNDGNYIFNFTKTDNDNQFSDAGSVAAGFVKRGITVEPISRNTYVNQPSDPLFIKLQIPNDGALTFTAVFFDSNTNDSVATPFGSVTIPAGALTGYLIFRNIEQVNLQVEYNLTVSGDHSDWYNTDAVKFQHTNFRVVNRVVQVLGLDDAIFMGNGQSWNNLTFYTPQLVNSSLTITPQAADTVFIPSSATFNPNTQVQSLQFQSVSQGGDGVAFPTKEIFYTITGDDASFYDIETGPLSGNVQIAPRIVSFDYPSTFVISNQTYMSIRIDGPTPSSLKVSLNTAGLVFNTSTVEFKGSVTAITVLVTPVYLGTDTIYFTLSGDDAYYFTKPADQAYTVHKKGFIQPYFPAEFWVGVESERIPVRASITPNKTSTDVVNLVPTGRNLRFNPPILTFRDGTEEQYYTITPLYTNAGDSSSYSTAVTWVVTGVDGQYTVYETPEPKDVTVTKRDIQPAWSAHLNTLDKHAGEPGTCHLHKTYKIWVSANYINDKESVSVTPVSPFFSFKPAIMWFNTKNTRYLLEATVTGVVFGGASDSIKFILGGNEGGLYNPVPALTFTTAIRPLDIVAATLSPDERSKGVWIGERLNFYSPSRHNASVKMETFEPAWLQQYHVQDFLVRSFVLPDKDLTIIPHCNHAKFSPAKITLKAHHGTRRIDNMLQVVAPSTWPGSGEPLQDRTYSFNVTGVYLEANFSVTGLAGGSHPVWFELQGADSDYYTKPTVPNPSDPNNPSTVYMTFNLVERPDSEPFRVSSSSFLFPSFVVVAAMAIFSLVM